MTNDFSNLKRGRQPMPEFVKHALSENGLTEAYRERPAYQQNDYLGWIQQAKMEETKQRRLAQMIEELKAGGIYMKMKYPASAKKT
ncbi:MAG: YdeI/OmpD-associated family protein [Gammaproteobacteria bacterium]|nr:YdeI/OmpD-associated family protein [Gammaproteobacteria bacterium]MCB1871809.1 YdeI/OmpD-associated family protein [Gammaproteobacteria bacterium]MCB1878620.1 YdeI/OmpD-associated family protein [Gammaproteobacteria bacterium]MCP5427553.1 YdeI/OmpD-associated family protein [Chromatiaceae bacterium]